MTTKNAILLIIKQNNGIEYNSLLNKIAANYSGINSARAALSRTLKDLSAFGFIVRKGNNLFVTEQSASVINAEMKNKLLLRLNEAINSKDNYLAIDQIVENLHTLIERSKEDKDLLKIAKGGADFYISDLVEINSRIRNRIKHLSYMTRVFQRHIESLKEMDFNDARKENFDEKTIRLISEIALKLGAAQFLVQSNNPALLEKLGGLFDAKPRENNLVLPIPRLQEFMEQLKPMGQLPPPEPASTINIYLASLRLKLQWPSVYFIGPYSQLNELLSGAVEKQ